VAAEVCTRPAKGGDLFGDGFQLGIFAADRGDVVGGARGQLRLEKFEALRDLGEFFVSYHRCCAARLARGGQLC